MLLKARSESEELLCTRYLNVRKELTEKEKFHYSNLEKGYEGEKKFDLLTASLEEERYLINDLLLNVNNSYFQIDSVIISQGVTHLIDIKNFEGDFYLESDKLYTVKTKREYKNPVDQLKRSTMLFRQLLQIHKLDFLVEPLVIFINSEFTLYQTPMNQPIIFPGQVHRFLKELNKTTTKLNDGHKKLAQTLLSLHQTKNPFAVIPEYNYEELQKGIYCGSCHSFLISIINQTRQIIECNKCGFQESVEQAILRNIAELKQLFPDQKLTTQSIYEWCNVDISKKTYNRILQNNYQKFGSTKAAYFQ